MHALGAAALAGVQRALPAPQFSERPGPVYRGDKPGRDPLRLNWWTPRLQRDLAQAEVLRSLERSVQAGDVLASLSPASVASAVLAQAQGGGGGGGGTGEGEGPGGSGGSGSGGGAGSGGMGGSGGGEGGAGQASGSGGGSGGATTGGLAGSANTNTGNKLSTLSIVSWPSRGSF
jgi:hypothetical protein